MQTLCLVLDIDETILHYTMTPDAGINYDNLSEQGGEGDEEEENHDTLTGIFRPNDKLYFRPGFWDFIEYVKSKEGKIVLGIWTFGNRVYADGLKPYLGDIFEFVYTAEDMKPGMLDKQLNYVVDRLDSRKRKILRLPRTKKRGVSSKQQLPKNIFLVDNRPQNINHDINRKNGIMVESFLGKTKEDTMFENLEVICESLLSTGQIPPKYMQKFRIEGKLRTIASIGTNFDDGIRPIISSRSESGSGSGSRSGRSTRRKYAGGKDTTTKDSTTKNSSNRTQRKRNKNNASIELY
jgi:hypothetical protein